MSKLGKRLVSAMTGLRDRLRDGRGVGDLKQSAYFPSPCPGCGQPVRVGEDDTCEWCYREFHATCYFEHVEECERLRAGWQE